MVSRRSIRNAGRERRSQPTATSGVQTITQQWLGLEAVTLTGTDATNNAVADFSTAVATRLAGQETVPATPVGSTPWLHTPSVTLGSFFAAQPEADAGWWDIDAVVPVLVANRITAGLSIDGIAADLAAATSPILPVIDRLPDVQDVTGVAAAGLSIRLHTSVNIRHGRRPVVRLLLTNGAGAIPAAAGVRATGVFIRFTFKGGNP